MSLPLHLPAALLRDILTHATRKSSLPAVLQQLPAPLRRHTAEGAVQKRSLRLSDTFASANELALFLDQLPHESLLLAQFLEHAPSDTLVVEEIYLNNSTPCGLRIPTDHRCSTLLSNLLSSQHSLHSLNLSGLILPRGPQGTRPPLDAYNPRLGPLQLPRSIQRLVLSRCELSHHPTGTLPRLCSSLSRVTHLDLSHNALGVLGISALAPVLRTLTCLATLDISSNGIRKEGSVALAPHLATLTTLTALHLASNVLQAAGIEALAEVLPTLPLLATLDISGGVFSDAGASTLSAVLPRMPALQHLDLAWSALCDAGVSNLRPGLTAPRVAPPSDPPSEPPLSAEPHPVPPIPTGLTYLSLRNNNITPAVIGDICVMCVRVASTLRHLDLSCNRLRWGAGVLAETLTRMHELRVLVLRDTCMRASDFTLLAPALAGLRHLSHVDVSSNDLCSPFGVLLDSIDRKSRQHSPRKASISSRPHSASLQATEPPLHPASAAWVNMHGSSSEASTSNACVIEAEEQTQTLPSGASQCLTKGSNMHAAHACAMNTSITHLNLSSGFDVDRGDPFEVVGWDVPPVVHDLVREIVNRAVEDLAFGGTGGHNAQRAWRPPTVHLPNLQFLDLSGTSDAFPGVSGVLMHCSNTLESLNLACTGLTASMARTLREPLAACTRLTSLDISHNACMGASGGMELAEALRTLMHTLHVLSVAMCDVGGAVIAETCIAGGSRLVPNACKACKCSPLPARMASDPGVCTSSATCMQAEVSTGVHTPAVHARLVFGEDDKTFTQSVEQWKVQKILSADAKGSEESSDACTLVSAGISCAKPKEHDASPTECCCKESVNGSEAPVAEEAAMHVPHARVQSRRVSAPVTEACVHALCCDAHTVRVGTACISHASTSSASHSSNVTTSATQGCAACLYGSSNYMQSQQGLPQQRQLFQLQSLNLKGVGLGQSAGIQVLRELAVCAPKLKKLDIGATKLTDGEQVGLVRSALDSLTQVTMLGISKLSL